MSDGNYDYEFKCDDCVRYLRDNPETFNLMVTSPPYNVGKDYGAAGKDRMKEPDYLAFLKEFSFAVSSSLAPNGSLFLNFGTQSGNQVLAHKVVMALTKHLKLHNTFHWVKSISLSKGGQEEVWDSSGHFSPSSSKKHPHGAHEYVWQFVRPEDSPVIGRLNLGVPYADKSNVKRWGHTGGRDRRCRGNLWFIPYKTIQKQRSHPAPFPPELVEYCIRIANPVIEAEDPGGFREHLRYLKMLDPFCGEGNSAIAARKQGVGFYRGVDLNPDFVDMAQEHWRA